MRKVFFKVWIPPKYDKLTIGHVKGTGCWSEEKEGLFHQWASACEEGEDNFGNYTVALVEQADGTIAEVVPTGIRFATGIEEGAKIEVLNYFKSNP